MIFNPLLYYVVNFSVLNKPKIYSRGLRTVEQAHEAVAYYLGDVHYKVVEGSFAQLLPYKVVPSVFKSLRPSAYLDKGATRRELRNLSRARLKGSGIRTHSFKAIWEPLPESREDRIRYFNQDRTKIRTRILKS